MRAGAEGRGRARRTQSEKSIFKRQKSLLGDPESKIPSEKVSTLSLLLLLCAVTVRKHWELRGPGGGGSDGKAKRSHSFQSPFEPRRFSFLFLFSPLSLHLKAERGDFFMLLSSQDPEVRVLGEKLRPR